MDDNEFEAKLHRTWLEYLVATNQREIAAVVLDAEVNMWQEDYNSVEVVIDLPVSSYVLLEGNEELEKRIIKSFRTIIPCQGIGFTFLND